MKINYLFKIIRESKNIKQRHVAESVGITRSALSSFELERYSLSHQTLLKIASLLEINPDYIVDSMKNPFKTNKLIKMYFSEKYIDKVFEPTFTLILANQKLEFISLIAKIDPIMRIRSITLRQNPVYAVAVRDQDNNIFLLRRKYNTNYVLADGNLYDKISFTIRSTREKRKLLYFASKEIDKNLYKKIKDWTVERGDIDPLFSQCEFSFYIDPAEEELVQLRYQRDLGIEPLTELELMVLKRLREKKISTDEVMAWLKSEKVRKDS